MVVYTQGFLTNGINLYYYAINILLEDPAIKFSFRIAKKNINNKPFSIFIYIPNKVTVKNINTLVNCLSGKNVNNITTKLRRIIPTDITKGRYKVIYI